MRADHADRCNLQPGLRTADPDDGCANRKRSVRTMRAYTEYECSNTQNMSKADAVRRSIGQQAEQIRRMTPDEYIRYRKTGKGSRQ